MTDTNAQPADESAAMREAKRTGTGIGMAA